jgi:hypothetical protein
MIDQIRHLQARVPFETFALELATGRVIQIHDWHLVATTSGTHHGAGRRQILNPSPIIATETQKSVAPLPSPPLLLTCENNVISSLRHFEEELLKTFLGSLGEHISMVLARGDSGAPGIKSSDITSCASAFMGIFSDVPSPTFSLCALRGF